jgi:hypothetical protein
VEHSVADCPVVAAGWEACSLWPFLGTAFRISLRFLAEISDISICTDGHVDLPEAVISTLRGEADRLTYASMQRAGPLRVTTTGPFHRQRWSVISMKNSFPDGEAGRLTYAS